MAEERIVRVRDRAAVLDALRPRLRPGDVVLVKASRGIELDRLVDDLVHELRGTAGGNEASPRSGSSAVGARR
jgi:UDP-N-acetylmuramoyl-tripeptide--D-alanyl-D-alanine ligase